MWDVHNLVDDVALGPTSLILLVVLPFGLYWDNANTTFVCLLLVVFTLPRDQS